MRTLPNRLFVMRAYETAYKHQKITKRYHRGSIRKLVDGWIPNYIWNDLNTVGSTRRARYVHNDPKYAHLFETITRKEYMARYFPSLEASVRSNYEYTRVIPSKRLIWNLIVGREMRKWKEKAK